MREFEASSHAEGLFMSLFWQERLFELSQFFTRWSFSSVLHHFCLRAPLNWGHMNRSAVTLIKITYGVDSGVTPPERLNPIRFWLHSGFNSEFASLSWRLSVETEPESGPDWSFFFFFSWLSDLQRPLPLLNLWPVRRNPGSEKWVRLVWKPWMEAGATGPPNHTKAAPQLFGGETGLPEGPDFRAKPPDWRSRWLPKPSCYLKTVKKSSKKKCGVSKIHHRQLLFSALNWRQRCCGRLPMNCDLDVAL